MPNGPLSIYRARRGTGTLREDPDQELAAEKLESLYHALSGYQPSPARGKEGWLERFGLARRRVEEAPPPPQGLYMYGGVGRGKSMLMDLFYESAPVGKRRRVHFHAFMLEVHERVHQWRAARKAANGGRATTVDDAVPELARQIAEEAWLLCFDEFHVVDIADAMILGRLFTHLFELGVVVVATSNWAPDDLYKNGIQRDRFLPFIALLKERVDILALDGGVDYRLDRLKGMPVYYCPLGPATERKLADAFFRLTDNARPAADHLLVQGRRVEIPRCAKGVAWLDFWELCGKPFGAADYLAIGTHFHTVILAGIPCLKAEQRNEAKRLMTLVDALYEHKVKVLVGADCPPHKIYAEGTHAFEFERTVSRLMEMQSEDYLQRPHLT